MLPQIQLQENSNNVKLYWETDKTPSVKSFKLYWSLDQDTGFVLLADKIANQASLFGKYVGYSFTRSGISVKENQVLFLKLSSVTKAGVEVELSDARRIPVATDEPPTVGSTEVAYAQQHGWDKDENTWRRVGVKRGNDGTGEVITNPGLEGADVKSRVIGTVSEQVLFAEGVKVVEVFNFSTQHTVFVDTTGVLADPTIHIPVMPRTYYVFEINIARESGIAVVSSGAGTDVRIVGHFG